MPENILVVEYEPRYTDRVRQALSGQPFTPSFAKDGEEALRALDIQQPSLIVLSSVVPKVSTTDLIRAIRGRDALSRTPILLTVSGYRGESPKQDAIRLGASDILPKPYSETEFLGKVQQMLGIRPSSVSAKQMAPELDADFTVRASAIPAGDGQLTSNEIFGELLEDERVSSNAARRPMKPKDDVDKMLADTLAGMMPQKKKDPATPPAAPTPPATPGPTAAQRTDARQKTQSAELDKMLQDTLSGLDRPARKTTSPGTVPTPPPPPAAATPAAAPIAQPVPPAAKYQTARIPTYAPDKVPIAQPVFPQAAPPPPLEEEEPTDGIRFGQYVLLEKIATGGMAEVWKARMRGVEGFQKTVAIKKILPHLSDNQDFIEMFVDEAKLAAQLSHNNIIHIYDLGKIANSYYIAMEYIDGYDLKTILKKAQDRDHPMTVELALFIASKVAAALDYAHRKLDFEGKDLGLVHRDVSPQNVLISQEGDIKLCDFGIAKAASKASHTQAGALKGKLQYMSPEQAWGRNIDKRSDIFALATVLFEMLTSRKLFTGDNELSILEQVREARVAPPSQLNDEVTTQIDAIVLKALQKDPANRYQTAGDMQRDIDAVLYSFKPTPASADLAIYMHRLGSSEPVAPHVEVPHEPEPAAANELRPAAAPKPPVPAPIPAPAREAKPAVAIVAAEHAPAKKAPILPIAIAVTVVIAAIAGFFMMRGKSTATTTPSAVTKPANTPTTQTTSTAVTSTVAQTASALTGTAATSTAPALDSSKVDAEVQKRLAAERARLEQLARAQQPTTTNPANAQRATPAPAAPPPVVPPTIVENRPTPAPQPPAPQQQVPETRPAPAPQPAEPAPVARAQAGDLIPPGAAGLTPARITRQAPATYPQIAKMQHIEGSVIISVLVSETGRVLETRIITGSKTGGLNEAADQSIRRSTFAPGEKDGVRVKSWTTVRVDFKL